MKIATTCLLFIPICATSPVSSFWFLVAGLASLECSRTGNREPETRNQTLSHADRLARFKPDGFLLRPGVQPSLNHINRQGKHNSRIFLDADFGERLQIAQLHGDRLVGAAA